MANTVPAWLATMRDITGAHWKPGDGPNATITAWLEYIASENPEMAPYCNSVVHDEYFSWCGLTVGYCMAKSEIAPVFGTVDTSRFLFALAWLNWGQPAADPEPGDVLVFNFGGGDHHVTLFEKDNGDGTWSCRGGNQTHQVNAENFPKSKIVGIRRPISVASTTAIGAAPANPASQRFADCVARVLKSEGGNDDDPRDPGGRTSRGILQREWNEWLRTHPGLPADVFDAPQDEIVAIYHEKYWNVLSCADLPAGVDYAVFDYGVNSGNDRSAKALQSFAGVEADGQIGPKTIEATASLDPTTLVNQICTQRLAFLRALDTWPTFGKGWTARVQGVRTAALAMVISPTSNLARKQPTSPLALTSMPAAVPADMSDAIVQFKQLIDKLEGAVAKTVPVAARPQSAVGAPQPDFAALIQQALSLGQIVKAAQAQPAAAATSEPQDQIKQAISILTTLTGGTPGSGDGSGNSLGPVNGALGQTIGNLLDNKKSAIGIIGALATSVLQVVGPSVPINSILPVLGASATPGLGNVVMPLFLAMSAWGILGKMEKWSQTSISPK